MWREILAIVVWNICLHFCCFRRLPVHLGCLGSTKKTFRCFLFCQWFAPYFVLRYSLDVCHGTYFRLRAAAVAFHFFHSRSAEKRSSTSYRWVLSISRVRRLIKYSVVRTLATCFLVQDYFTAVSGTLVMVLFAFVCTYLVKLIWPWHRHVLLPPRVRSFLFVHVCFVCDNDDFDSRSGFPAGYSVSYTRV